MKSLTVILTGAGAPGAKGTEYALRKGARAQGVSLRIVGVDRNPAVAAQGFCDCVVRIPGPSDPSYGDELSRICREVGARVVVPQTTMEIEWLSANKVPNSDVRVMVNSRQAIEMANNKMATAAVFAELGQAATTFCCTHSEQEFTCACRELGYPHKPVVVKVPVSNGMRGLRILRPEAWDYNRFVSEKPSGTDCTLEQMLGIIRTAPSWPELMVCEYLEGDEYTVDCYVGRSGTLAMPRKRDVIRTGISFTTTLERHKEMMRISLEAAKKMGLRGVFGFQYKMHGGVPKILECNPRVQGTMIATLAAGNNIIWAAAADLMAEDLPPVELDSDWVGGKCFRYWGAGPVGNSGKLEVI